MLVIRKSQLDALDPLPQIIFEDQLLKHFRQHYPQDCRRAGATQIRKLIRMGIAQACGHRYLSQREVGYYVNLMLMLGCDLDRDPQIPWMCAQLNDLSIESGLDRIQRAFQSALHYLGEAFGEKSGYMARALVRVRDYDLASISSSGEQDLFELMNHICPQKVKVQGEGPTRALIPLCLRNAASYKIRTPSGVAVFLTLMFLLGAGFDHDPMYAWAEEALNDTSFTTEQDRIAHLHARAIAYVNQVLAEG